jgi:hypothetical protein
MKEYNKCDSCNAITTIDLNKCDYCGAYKSNDINISEIFKFKQNFDYKFLTIDDLILLNELSQSKYKNTIYVKYRRLKVLLNIEFKEKNNINSETLNLILSELFEIGNENEEYLKDFVFFFTLLTKIYSTNKITLDSYNSIISNLNNQGQPYKYLFEAELRNYFLRTYIGNKLIADFEFYTDTANFINDDNFLRKKEYVENQYITLKNNILGKLEKIQ